jgi:SAM-dependent methyltransferase
VSKAADSQSGAMSVDEIRPDALKRGQVEAYERDLARLRERLPEFVEVTCPACDGRERRPAFEKYGFQFQRCGRCRTLYMSPRPTPEIMGAYYGDSENYKYWAEHIFPASEPARREKIHRPMLAYIVGACDQRAVPRKLLVEVGPGFGTFAALASESGTFERVVAIERTPEMAEACRKRGVNVIEQAVEDVSLAELGHADVVASFEVIEHLFDPRAYLRAAARLLRPGGLLLLTCPNGEGFDTATLGAQSPAVDSEHVNLFNPESLTRLLASTGFEAIEVATPGRLDAELVRSAALEGRVDLSGNRFLRSVLLEQWEQLGESFQAFLAGSRLSGNLRILARRC